MSLKIKARAGIYSNLLCKRGNFGDFDLMGFFWPAKIAILVIFYQFTNLGIFLQCLQAKKAGKSRYRQFLLWNNK